MTPEQVERPVIASWCGNDRECGYDEPCDVHQLAARALSLEDKLSKLDKAYTRELEALRLSEHQREELEQALIKIAYHKPTGTWRQIVEQIERAAREVLTPAPQEEK